MTLRLILGIAVGMALGALVGYFGNCSSGACPLTANPFRGTIYGGILGAVFAFSLAGSVRPKVNAAPSESMTPEADSGKAAQVDMVCGNRRTTKTFWRRCWENGICLVAMCSGFLEDRGYTATKTKTTQEANDADL